MIFVYLKLAFEWLMKLFVPPPKGLRTSVDPHMPCPVCGHRSGTLKAVYSGTGIACEHTCTICGARFCELPIYNQKAADKFVVPVSVFENRFAAAQKLPAPIPSAAPPDPRRVEAILKSTKDQEKDGMGVAVDLPNPGGSA